MQLFGEVPYMGMPPMAPVSEETVFCAESVAPLETTGSVCTYDFGVIYLLDDQKRALSNSLANFNAVVGPLPYLSESEYPGHRSLISTSTACKSIADLPDAPSLITGTFDLDAEGRAFVDDFLSCPSCHMSFRSVNQLKAHRRIHEGEKPFSCQVCHRSFATKPSLLEHVLTHNTLDKTYPCPICKEILPRPGALKKHMENHRNPPGSASAGTPGMPQAVRNSGDIHTPPPPIALGVMDGRGHLISRQVLSHPPTSNATTAAGAAAAVAAAAAAAASRGSPMMLENGGPLGPRGVVAPGAMLNSDPLLVDVHKKAAKPVPELGSNSDDDDDEDDDEDDGQDPLETIDPSLPYNANSEDLLKPNAITGEFGKKPFVCKVCGKIFTQSGNLSRHRLVHSQEKPFQCNVCQKRFSQKSHLKTHQNVHSGERAFQCQICDKRFSQLGHLKTHLNVHRRTAETAPPMPPPLSINSSTVAQGARMVVRPTSGHLGSLNSVPVVQLFPPAVHASQTPTTAPAYASSSNAVLLVSAATPSPISQSVLGVSQP